MAEGALEKASNAEGHAKNSMMQIKAVETQSKLYIEKLMKKMAADSEAMVAMASITKYNIGPAPFNNCAPIS